MPQLPSCFPKLPPSSLQLRSFEVYHSPVFIVLVKTDKASNITFEFFDVRDCVDEGEEENVSRREEEEESEEECSKRKRNKRPRGVCVRKKMGYIITTMSTTSPNNPDSDRKCSFKFEYPSFKGIFLSEEYRNHTTGDQRVESGLLDKRRRHKTLSHAMMDFYCRFLAHLYKLQRRSYLGEGSADDTGKTGSMLLRTSCVMRKVLVCKLLTSRGWLPDLSSQGFVVVVLPRFVQLSAPCVFNSVEREHKDCIGDDDNAHVVRANDGQMMCKNEHSNNYGGANITRICSPMLSVQAMRSKLFSPRTCQAQGVELLSWQDAAEFQSLSRRSKICSQLNKEGSTTERAVQEIVGSEVTVNCQYSISLSDVMALAADERAGEGGVFSFEGLTTGIATATATATGIEQHCSGD